MRNILKNLIFKAWANVLKLLIIADDFTGSLDSGVQFAQRGANVKVVTDSNYNFTDSENENLDVLIFDSETRHLAPDKAYKIVRDFVSRSNVPYIYKKTDSGLRGNIGAELAACMDALNFDSLVFVPAFPAMNRITKNGVHYIDGVPVAKSMFGADPFEPVKFSSVQEIISSQTSKTGIKIFDSESESDMMRIAENNNLRLSAGCAAFAGILANILGFNESCAKIPEMPAKFFMICGSVNPVTRAQVDFAAKHGFKKISLSVAQKLSPSWPDSQECKDFAKKCLDEIKNFNAILDANNENDNKATQEFIRANNLSIDEVRLNISRSVTGAAKNLLDLGLDSRLMCVGGDTLLALMQSVNVSELIPICELAKGVVLTSFIYREKIYYIMTKSGGFGEADLLVKLAK